MNVDGIASTINCANYVYFIALERCHSLNNSKATTLAVFLSKVIIYNCITLDVHKILH